MAGKTEGFQKILKFYFNQFKYTYLGMNNKFYEVFLAYRRKKRDLSIIFNALIHFRVPSFFIFSLLM